MIKSLENTYAAFTLMETLVVMSIVIIIGGMGMYAFGGLRDSITVNQDIATLQLDIKRAQQAAMLMQKESGENWSYGIGIDFTKMTTEGKYRVFKWCSPYTDFGAPQTTSEIPAFDSSNDSNTIDNPPNNGIMPTTQNPSNCNSGNGAIPSLTGYDLGILAEGYDVQLDDVEYGNGENTEVDYLLFESVTGRALLYGENGYPVNYNAALEYVDTNKLVIHIHRNQGAIEDVVTIYPGSGMVTHDIVNN